jgi:hypothetical protein
MFLYQPSANISMGLPQLKTGDSPLENAGMAAGAPVMVAEALNVRSITP